MLFKSYLFLNNFGNRLKYEYLLIFNRGGHILRGKPPSIARSLEQRLKDENVIDPEITRRINIGFPKLRLKRSLQLKERLSHVKAQRSNAELEKQARNCTLMINLEDVRKEYLQTSGQYHLRRIGEHYGIYKDLFGYAYFVPRVSLDIKYTLADSTFCPVNCGNVVLPSEAKEKPEVNFDGSIDLLENTNKKNDNFWSLLLTNPDGHFSGEENEYIHWFIGNISGSSISSGEEIVPYLQPFPPRGLGYQRFIFIMYKQEGKIDLSKYKIKESFDLDKRTFSTKDFYKQNEEGMTPAGLAFFQSTWDKSITKFYHDQLGFDEPVYEYDFPAPYIADQKLFPLKKPFNLYMDKYRDLKQVHKEYLERKLAKSHPFDGPEPSLRFPNAHPLKDIPSWLRTEIKKDRLRIGRINDI